ncbi:MAG TPA: glycosyltransferase [Thiobacillaceae bacterium]|nr:glycosyltransferase [Thiobacillaceae bacterium]HNU65335.1 glycosyltransferase [Thiobacillaceae bacterium]
MPASVYQGLLREPWLGFSRWLTCHALGRRLLRPRGATPYEPGPDRVLYVAASTLPYHTSGYTTRTHEIVSAMRAAGAWLRVLTRPGYPWDRRDRLLDAKAEETLVDGVHYRHARQPSNDRPVLFYALQAARVVAKEATRERVGLIHAASNHVNALPALLAARGLGLPFQYEMRGLWELTRISRQPAYEGSQAFRQGLQLEALVARHADRVCVISEQLGRYVHSQWGVPQERLALLPNCIDPLRFKVADAADVEPRSIGYAGSLIGYEGLDTLIEAVARLKDQGIGVRVHIVGEGEARGGLEALVSRLGVAEYVRFLGRQPPAVARELIRRCALVCLPRKPFRVCEIVTPIKLVEALAMGKPVIVPDLPVFRDELGPDPAGWFFQAGNAGDLARVVETAFSNAATLAEKGARARDYAVSERNWERFVATVLAPTGAGPAAGRCGHG